MQISNTAYGSTDGARSYDYAVVIGRFQPVHQGHVALLRAGLQHARKLIVVAGSMSQPRSFKNPFTVDEREQMIRAALPACDQARVQVTGVSDAPYDDAEWLQAVQAAVYAAMRAQGDDPATARVALLGHMKDQSSYYLRIFPNWQWQPFANVEGIDATAIRHSYFSDEKPPHALPPLWQQQAVLPASTVDFLRTFRQTPPWQALHDERAFLLDFGQQHRYAHGGAMPVLCLVQAVVLWRQHILLVQRQQQPGRGNWALPETLLQAGERLLDAAGRALRAVDVGAGEGAMEGVEQACTAATLRAHVRASAVLDVPGRNQLGQAISHAFLLQWPDDAPAPWLPAADVPHRVRWQPVAQWPTMQPLLHEDHYFIARHFLDTLTATSAAAPATASPCSCCAPDKETAV